VKSWDPQQITAWLADLYGKTLEGHGIRGSGMDVVPMRCEQHGHVFNTVVLSTVKACTGLVRMGVCDAAACDLALMHFCQLVLATGGLSGLLRIIGGGSSKATVDLGADIVAGVQLATTAARASRSLPSWLLMPFLWLLQLCLQPMQWVKASARRAIVAAYGPFLSSWDESPEGNSAFERVALGQVCSLEALAAEKRRFRVASHGGA